MISHMQKIIGVIGAGTMGNSIGALFASRGFRTFVYDNNAEALERGKNNALKSLSRLKMEDTSSNLIFTSSMKDLSGCSFIVEAVPEVLEIKREVYRDLENIVPVSAIFASNTSTIPISDLSDSLSKKERLIGTHFFNPPIIMPLVEVVRGRNTSDDTLQTTTRLMSDIGKKYVVISKEVPGFIVNRINARTFYETFSLIDEGYSPEEIDFATRNVLGFPMGMCELIDFVGLDVIYYGTRELMDRGFNTEMNRSLEGMFKEKRWGVKTGYGFYKYDAPGRYRKINLNEADIKRKVDPLRIIAGAINEAAWLADNGVSSQNEIDEAMKLAMNWPYGPFAYLDRFGRAAVIAELQDLYDRYGKSWYRPSELLSRA